MLLNVILLLAGFVILIYGADKLVDGGATLAARLNIPHIVIGLTVIAFGTSTPELVVNVISSVQGRSALALGNVLGSNIFNILAILGITAIIYPIGIKKMTTWVEVPMALCASVLVFITFCNDHWPVPASYVISRTEGIIFLCFFLVFVIYTLMLARKGECESISIKPYSIFRSLLYILIGITGLIVGGELLVKGAVSIAEELGISQRVIAITILSVGTSLPELATSLVAARKKNVDMAIGNVVGSNLFNTFLILGTSAVIRPIPMNTANLTDILVNIVATLLLFLFIFTGKGRRIEKWEGIIFVLLYILYLVMLLIQ